MTEYSKGCNPYIFDGELLLPLTGVYAYHNEVIDIIYCFDESDVITAKEGINPLTNLPFQKGRWIKEPEIVYETIEDLATFENLPHEIKFGIAYNLSPNDLINLCLTNKEFSKICDTTNFWKNYLKLHQDLIPKLKKLYFESVRFNDMRRVDFILKTGIDPNLKSRWGETALMSASIYGYDHIVKLLLKSGADQGINLQNNYGATALAYAISSRKGNDKIVELLLKSGADEGINLQDNDGKTALMLASEKGYDKTVKLLKNYGAS